MLSLPVHLPFPHSNKGLVLFSLNSGKEGGRAARRNTGFCFQKSEPPRGEKIQGVDNVPYSEMGRESHFLPSGGSPSCLQQRGLWSWGRKLCSPLGSMLIKCRWFIQADGDQAPSLGDNLEETGGSDLKELSCEVRLADQESPWCPRSSLLPGY